MLQAVTKDCKAHGVKVVAVGQFDATAWVERGIREEVSVIVDFTSDRLM